MLNTAVRGSSRFAMLLGVILVGSVSADWLDDFNDGNAEDGNPVTWHYNELGLTPGIYTAASGDYSLSAPGGPTGDDDSLVASVSQIFSDTYVRSQGVIVPGPLPVEVGGNVGLVARFNPTTFSGYAALLDDGEQFAVIRVDFGGVTVLDGADGIGIDAFTDVLMEMEVVGSQINTYFWRPGTPRPAVPISSVTDTTYTSGVAGILYNEDDDNTAGLFRFAAARSTPFTTAACDFNQDGRCDITDLDALAMDAAAGTNTATFDLTADGLVNLQDVDSWRSSAGNLNIGPERPYRVGDANLDGVVDGTDFGIWNSNKFTSTGKWSKGDFNVDGVSDGSDFGLWNANKFTASDGSLVPEPVGLMTAVAGILALALKRRH